MEWRRSLKWNIVEADFNYNGERDFRGHFVILNKRGRGSKIYMVGESSKFVR